MPEGSRRRNSRPAANVSALALRVGQRTGQTTMVSFIPAFVGKVRFPLGSVGHRAASVKASPRVMAVLFGSGKTTASRNKKDSRAQLPSLLWFRFTHLENMIGRACGLNFRRRLSARAHKSCDGRRRLVWRKA